MLVRKKLAVYFCVARYEVACYITAPYYTPKISKHDGVWWVHCGPIEILVERGHRFDKPKRADSHYEGDHKVARLPESLSQPASQDRDADNSGVSDCGTVRKQVTKGHR